MVDIENCFKMTGDVTTTLLFIYLIHIADDKGRVNATYDNISKTLNRPKTTIYRYVTRLIKRNLVEQRRNKGGTKAEQKRVLLYIPQISDYKQVVNIDKNKGGTKTEQRRNKGGTKNIEERKHDFVERLKPYVEKYGKDMLNDFYRYWTQVNDGGTKMLWEKQKCFEIGLRLATWRRNEEKQTKQNVDIGMVIQPTKNKFENEETW